MELVGKIYAKEAKQQKTENFAVQEFVIDSSFFDRETGEKRENFIRFQCTNRNIDELEKVAIGDKVRVSFGINGRYYENEAKEMKHAQNLNAYKFEKMQ